MYYCQGLTTADPGPSVALPESPPTNMLRLQKFSSVFLPKPHSFKSATCANKKPGPRSERYCSIASARLRPTPCKLRRTFAVNIHTNHKQTNTPHQVCHRAGAAQREKSLRHFGADLHVREGALQDRFCFNKQQLEWKKQRNLDLFGE